MLHPVYITIIWGFYWEHPGIATRRAESYSYWLDGQAYGQEDHFRNIVNIFILILENNK